MRPEESYAAGILPAEFEPGELAGVDVGTLDSDSIGDLGILDPKPLQRKMLSGALNVQAGAKVSAKNLVSAPNVMTPSQQQAVNAVQASVSSKMARNAPGAFARSSILRVKDKQAVNAPSIQEPASNSIVSSQKPGVFQAAKAAGMSVANLVTGKGQEVKAPWLYANIKGMTGGVVDANRIANYKGPALPKPLTDKISEVVRGGFVGGKIGDKAKQVRFQTIQAAEQVKVLGQQLRNTAPENSAALEKAIGEKSAEVVVGRARIERFRVASVLKVYSVMKSVQQRQLADQLADKPGDKKAFEQLRQVTKLKDNAEKAANKLLTEPMEIPELAKVFSKLTNTTMRQVLDTGLVPAKVAQNPSLPGLGYQKIAVSAPSAGRVPVVMEQWKAPPGLMAAIAGSAGMGMSGLEGLEGLDDIEGIRDWVQTSWDVGVYLAPVVRAIGAVVSVIVPVGTIVGGAMIAASTAVLVADKHMPQIAAKKGDGFRAHIGTYDAEVTVVVGKDPWDVIAKIRIRDDSPAVVNAIKDLDTAQQTVFIALNESPDRGVDIPVTKEGGKTYAIYRFTVPTTVRIFAIVDKTGDLVPITFKRNWIEEPREIQSFEADAVFNKDANIFSKPSSFLEGNCSGDNCITDVNRMSRIIGTAKAGMKIHTVGICNRLWAMVMWPDRTAPGGKVLAFTNIGNLSEPPKQDARQQDQERDQQRDQQDQQQEAEPFLSKKAMVIGGSVIGAAGLLALGWKLLGSSVGLGDIEEPSCGCGR